MNPTPETRWKCVCAYDGTSFAGWQSQARSNAVQDIIEARFDDLTGAELRYLVENEWAETAEDVLWRRTKLGLKARPDERIAINQFIVSLSAKAAS